MNFPEGYPFHPHTCTINGHTLSYLDEGEGPVIVMLHGNPTWSFFYRNLVLELRDRFRIIVPDHIGCGFSDKPQNYPYRLKNHIDNLNFLLDHLQIKQHALVVHDWGGAIGMGYVARHPERISCLVIFNTAAFPFRRIPFRISICRIPFLGTLLVRGLNGFCRAALHMAVNRPLPDPVAQGFLLPYNNWANRVAILRFVQDIPLRPPHPSWPALLEAEKGVQQCADLPSTIIWGGKDFCFNSLFFEEWKKRLPGAQSHFLPNASHYLLEDATDEVIEHTKNFLDNTQATGPHKNTQKKRT